MTAEKLKIAELAQILGFPLNQGVQEDLYVLALTHSSFANEQRNKLSHNERLELLGDSVLGLCITEYLYKHFPHRNEGRLSKLRSYIVSAESLAVVAKEYNLGHFILLGKGESQDGGQYKDSVLANLIEALIGACYLDQGIEKARELILLLMKGQLERYQNRNYSPQDDKLRLQEYVQKHYKTLPRYQTTELFSIGFKAMLYINEQFVCSGTSNSKKQAEKQAAKQALEQIIESE